jgi:hypothetical protein
MNSLFLGVGEVAGESAGGIDAEFCHGESHFRQGEVALGIMFEV